MHDLKGTIASPGIAMGKAMLVDERKKGVTRKKIDDAHAEIKKYHLALEDAEKVINGIKESYKDRICGGGEDEIFQAQLLLLKDPEFIGLVEDKIKNEKINVEASIKDAVDYFREIFCSIEDEYIKTRISDIEDVGEILLCCLQGDTGKINIAGEKIILVAKDLTPSDTASLNPNKILGFVTEEGSRTSHTAFIAQSLNLPAVVGTGRDTISRIKDNDFIIVDGCEGRVYINPTPDLIGALREKSRLFKKKSLSNSVDVKKPVATKDGIRVEIGCNIGSAKEVDQVLDRGGDGVGLFRTEFLYINSNTLPGEDEQYRTYKTVVEKIAPGPVVFRTLDIGGDKHLDYLELPEETNPFLGYRAVRIYSDYPDIIMPQLKAILRASVYGNVKIMFPMITSLEEVELATELLQKAKSELERARQDYNPKVEVGIMIEVPGAALIAEYLARKVDFFSIGTNDLIQYTLAADRNNCAVSNIYSPYHPSVLKIIKHVVEAGHEEGIWVGLCGKAAEDELLIPFLIGLGIDELSISAFSVGRIKEMISLWSKKEAKKVVESILKKDTAPSLKKELESYLLR